jgi:hypothetical protein
MEFLRPVLKFFLLCIMFFYHFSAKQLWYIFCPEMLLDLEFSHLFFSRINVSLVQFWHQKNTEKLDLKRKVQYHMREIKLFHFHNYILAMAPQNPASFLLRLSVKWQQEHWLWPLTCFWRHGYPFCVIVLQVKWKDWGLIYVGTSDNS